MTSASVSIADLNLDGHLGPTPIIDPGGDRNGENGHAWCAIAPNAFQSLFTHLTVSAARLLIFFVTPFLTLILPPPLLRQILHRLDAALREFHHVLPPSTRGDMHDLLLLINEVRPLAEQPIRFELGIVRQVSQSAVQEMRQRGSALHAVEETVPGKWACQSRIPLQRRMILMWRRLRTSHPWTPPQPRYWRGRTLCSDLAALLRETRRPCQIL